MKNLLTTVSLIILSTAAFAQATGTTYQTAIGVKFYPGAVSIKHFVTDQNAVEGLGYFFERGLRVAGLFEIHNDINGAQGLRWYAGPGAHITSYKSKYGGGIGVGIDGVLGLDYKVNNAPLNLSLDWQPSYEFGNGVANRGFTGNWGGIGIRYTL